VTQKVDEKGGAKELEAAVTHLFNAAKTCDEMCTSRF